MKRVYLKITTVNEKYDLRISEICHLNDAEAALNAGKENVELYVVPYSDWAKVTSAEIHIGIGRGN